MKWAIAVCFFMTTLVVIISGFVSRFIGKNRTSMTTSIRRSYANTVFSYRMNVSLVISIFHQSKSPTSTYISTITIVLRIFFLLLNDILHPSRDYEVSPSCYHWNFSIPLSSFFVQGQTIQDRFEASILNYKHSAKGLTSTGRIRRSLVGTLVLLLVVLLLVVVVPSINSLFMNRVGIHVNHRVSPLER